MPKPMDEQPFFADVDLPFHVWVREGRRWVLRDAAARLQGDAARSSADDSKGAAREKPAGR